MNCREAAILHGWFKIRGHEAASHPGRSFVALNGGLFDLISAKLIFNVYRPEIATRSIADEVVQNNQASNLKSAGYLHCYTAMGDDFHQPGFSTEREVTLKTWRVLLPHEVSQRWQGDLEGVMAARSRSRRGNEAGMLYSKLLKRTIRTEISVDYLMRVTLGASCG